MMKFYNILTLECYNNKLEVLDVTSNNNISWLKCQNNQIKELDLSNNPNISSINCSYNQLEVLDLSNQKSLRSINIIGNKFTTQTVKICNSIPYNIDATPVLSSVLYDKVTCQ